MLELTRKQNECIVIDDDIEITLPGNNPGRVTSGIEAAEDFDISSEEIHLRFDASLADAIEFTNVVVDGEYHFSSPEHVDHCSDNLNRHWEYARKPRAVG